MKNILKKLFKKTVIELQQDAINKYSRLDNRFLLSNAIEGCSFYVRGKTQANGKHRLYKFTPQDLGEHETVVLRPNNKSYKVHWKEDQSYSKKYGKTEE